MNLPLPSSIRIFDLNFACWRWNYTNKSQQCSNGQGPDSQRIL